MMDKTIDLDQHRGMAAQKATEVRRLVAEVEANERTLRLRQPGPRPPRRRAICLHSLPQLRLRKIRDDKN